MADIDSLLAQIEANDKPLTWGETGLGVARSVLSGPTFNYGDNLEALLFSVIGPQTYDQELSQIRSEQDRFKQRVDYLDNAVEIGSSFLNPLSALDKVKKGAGLASTIAKVVGNPITESAIAGAGLADGGDVVANAGIGALGGTVGSVGASVLGKTFEKAGKEADRLKLSAFGIGYQDIKNQIKKAGDYFAKSEGDLPIISVVDKAEKEGVINAGNEAVENLASILGKQESISEQLKGVISQVDEVMPPTKGNAFLGTKDTGKVFQTSNTEGYINSLSGTAKDKAREAANREIAALKNQIADGSISELQNLKVGLNYKYDKNPYTEDIIKAVRQDLKEEIENRINKAVDAGLVPADLRDSARLLNSEWGGLADLRDYFNKGLARDYGGDVVEDFYRSFQTTGGAGSFNVMSAASGNPLWSILGQGLNLVRYNENKSALADVLRTFQDPLQWTGSKLSNITGRVSTQAQDAAGIPDAILGAEGKPAQTGNVSLSIDDLLSQIEKSSNSGKNPTQSPPGQTVSPQAAGSLGSEMIENSANTPSLQNTGISNPKLESALKNVIGEDMYKKQPVKQVIEAVKQDPVDHAIMLMESGGNPKAKNPESSASGLFQLIKKTAGNLGVEDVFDAGDNYDGYLKLKQTAIDKYGVDPSDYKSLYSFHYLGETAFRKLLNGEELSGKQKAQVEYLKNKLFPKLDKFYQKAIKETGQVTA